MPDDVARLPWTEEQWTSIQRVVQETAGKARVGSSFLPLVGPVAPGAASVPELSLEEPDDQGAGGSRRLEIDDSVTLPFITLSALVYLTTQQVEDPELASAKQLLARTAGIIGRLEDAVIFNGLPESRWPSTVNVPKIYEIHARRGYSGLFSRGGLTKDFVKDVNPDAQGYGAHLVDQVNAAILTLESGGHFGPFACVLGQKLFADANASFLESLITPKERILPVLEGGPLLRSSVVEDTRGVVVSLAGSPIDLVVASDLHVKFLQVNVDARYVLRISERFVLRIKQREARCLLDGKPRSTQSEGTTAPQA